MGIKGDIINVALDLLGRNLTSLVEILTTFKNANSWFIGREVINNESYKILLIRSSFTSIQTGVRIISSSIRPSVITVA
jgi:hypothetical protein